MPARYSHHLLQRERAIVVNSFRFRLGALSTGRYERSYKYFSGMAFYFMLGSGQVTTRRTLRRTSIKVQLRMTFMDVCCGPPLVQLPA